MKVVDECLDLDSINGCALFVRLASEGMSHGFKPKPSQRLQYETLQPTYLTPRWLTKWHAFYVKIMQMRVQHIAIVWVNA